MLRNRSFLRFLTFFEVSLRGATLNDVSHRRLVIEYLHYLRARIVDAFRHDLAALHIALNVLKVMVIAFRFNQIMINGHLTLIRSLIRSSSVPFL